MQKRKGGPSNVVNVEPYQVTFWKVWESRGMSEEWIQARWDARKAKQK